MVLFAGVFLAALYGVLFASRWGAPARLIISMIGVAAFFCMTAWYIDFLRILDLLEHTSWLWVGIIGEDVSRIFFLESAYYLLLPIFFGYATTEVIARPASSWMRRRMSN